ncbi:hypothetical protein GCM10008014_54700 [Paenibacillus silvae]|uniref:Uncharacterized protein n=1 Tax=Paenibacillus silvae TaxID=1325358 RepID=A0ABQ1ZLN5_9BACL|nr:hypothetical protein GCM10008014_54700 [Paenibacillus silvae]
MLGARQEKVRIRGRKGGKEALQWVSRYALICNALLSEELQSFSAASLGAEIVICLEQRRM